MRDDQFRWPVLCTIFLRSFFVFLSFFLVSAFLPTVSAEEEAISDMSWASQNDDAMMAFRAGQYDVAEAAFLQNARCALRRERNLSATVDDARFGTRQENLDPTVSMTAFQTRTNLPQRTGQTCTQRGFQLYMAGLSQIQLGRPDDAKKSLKKATSLSKSLYDAHYKLALMALLDGDQKTARR